MIQVLCPSPHPLPLAERLEREEALGTDPAAGFCVG